MSGIPLLVEASGLRVLVVGAGTVGIRRASVFADGGAIVRVISREMPPSCPAVWTMICREYRAGDIGDAQLVVAATSDAAVNARIAADAAATGVLCNLASDGAAGTVTMMSVHRENDLVVGVSAGGLPAASRRIRDAIALRFDRRYGAVIASLRELRRSVIAEYGADEWKRRADATLDAQFCSRVENGDIAQELSGWQ